MTLIVLTGPLNSKSKQRSTALIIIFNYYPYDNNLLIELSSNCKVNIVDQA